MSKETMKLALEALKQIDEAMPFPIAKLAQAALREALAEQPAQQEQEPVAWIVEDQSGERLEWAGDAHSCHGVPTFPLYTSPPAQRKPLTDMQVDGEWILVRDLDTNDVEKSRLFARAIEAAHGIKENT